MYYKVYSLLYRLGEYPVHQGELNLLHPISDSSGSSASVFTISGVMYEGPEGVVSWSRSNSVIYCPNEMGSAF